MYFHKYFEKNFTNIKKWRKKVKGINSLLGRENKAHKDIISLKWPRGNLVSQNPSEFPDIKLVFASSFCFNSVSLSEIYSRLYSFPTRILR